MGGYFNIFYNNAVQPKFNINCLLLGVEEGRQEEDELTSVTELGDKKNSATCRVCGIYDFTTIADQPADFASFQREHFQSQWHQYNLQLKRRDTQNFRPLSEEEFENCLSAGASLVVEEEFFLDDDTLASQSWEIRQKLNRTCRTFFVTDENLVVSCYKAIFDPKQSNFICNEPAPIAAALADRHNWVILCLAGDHFAGAVFERSTCLLHKTLHRYTVRAKQGGSQGARDSQQTQNVPKSAGAQLRRQNEIALQKDIGQILIEWKPVIDSAHLIFLRYPSYHKTLFFNKSDLKADSKSYKFSRTDARVKNIPFVTRKPTLRELERAHKELSTFLIHGNKEDFLASLENDKRFDSKPAPSAKAKLNSKPVFDYDFCISENQLKNENPMERKVEPLEQKLQTNLHITYSKPVDLIEEHKRKLYTLCKLGDSGNLQNYVNQHELSTEFVKSFFNDLLTVKNSDFTTFLHCAAASGHSQMAEYLLAVGCDPGLKDGSGMTPYQKSSGHIVRQIFHKFRIERDLPDGKFFCDWSRTGIPSLEDIKIEEDKRRSKEAILLEKQRTSRKLKTEKAKLRKQEKRVIEKEEIEHQRFLALSDREKRALAAERRLLAACQNQNLAPPTLSLCQQCGLDITGRVPFEYSNFTFCTTKCVAAHRKEHKDF